MESVTLGATHHYQHHHERFDVGPFDEIFNEIGTSVSNKSLLLRRLPSSQILWLLHLPPPFNIPISTKDFRLSLSRSKK